MPSMTIYLTELDATLSFPSPDEALDEPNGLLAIGGDLSPSRLLTAYYNGIFPWYSAHQPILWWSPDPRGVLPIEQLHISRSLQKALNKTTLRFTVNQAFMQVVTLCAAPRRYSEETWITSDFMQSYAILHEMKQAHSIEVWDSEELVGGLYGISVGRLFCGESMFHLRPDASKMALVVLCRHLAHYGAPLIDCQMQNDYLATMGVQEWPRAEFLCQLAQLREQSFADACWQPQEISL
jgi:leucyl/phenylalanyl-tRNA--protein transferase